MMHFFLDAYDAILYGRGKSLHHTGKHHPKSMQHNKFSFPNTFPFIPRLVIHTANCFKF
jgi:hypothetical protein